MKPGADPDGVRVAGPPLGRPRVLRRHPRRAPDRAGAARRSRCPLPRSRRRRRRGGVTAERGHGEDARRARGRARLPRAHGDASLAAADRPRRRCRPRGRRRSPSRSRAGAAFLVAVDRQVPGALRRRGLGARRDAVRREVGCRPGIRRAAGAALSRGAGRRTTRMWSSPPTRCRRGSSTKAIRTGRAAGDGAGSSRSAQR